MNPGPEAPVRVDVFLPGLFVTGLTRQIGESYRLTDLLNSAEDAFSLSDVRVIALDGGQVESVRELTIVKGMVSAAVPREPQHLAEMQRRFRAGMARPGQQHLPVVVLAPPFTVKGMAHLPELVDTTRSVEPFMFPRFFPVTAARLFHGDREVTSAPAIIVNRDRLAGTARGAPETEAVPAVA
jgi:hypothetical protein